MSQEVRARLRTLSRDVLAMSDHASFLGTNLTFILDATLGLINIDQNNILKIFSVVTVFLLPPSVIGAVFGMNFSKMPWLHEPWGFWAAMGVMLASAIGPSSSSSGKAGSKRLESAAPAPVAQLDRVTASEAAGHWFESSRARQITQPDLTDILRAHEQTRLPFLQQFQPGPRHPGSP